MVNRRGTMSGKYYSQKNINQCDGCRRKLPLKDGVHKGDGYDMIGCTKDRYIQIENKNDGTFLCVGNIPSEEKCTCVLSKGVSMNEGLSNSMMSFAQCPVHNGVSSKAPEASWEEEFDKLGLCECEITETEVFQSDVIKSFISSLLATQKEEILETLLKRFDSLESTDPNKSTENWRNYKFIRNTIRDTLLSQGK